VAIARALVNEPSILMGDEPTGNLDSHTSREVIRIFRELNEQVGITVIIVTHDQHVAKNADRIIVLGDGEIVDDTTDYERAIKSLQAFETVEPAAAE
jgi:ABC-type lipoprotein export system ATPase subunit